MAPKDPFVAVKKKRKPFKWSDKMIENLVYCILNYKIKYFLMTDFDALCNRKNFVNPWLSFLRLTQVTLILEVFLQNHLK